VTETRNAEPHQQIRTSKPPDVWAAFSFIIPK